MGSAIYRKSVNSDVEVLIAGPDELDLRKQIDVNQLLVTKKFVQAPLSGAVKSCLMVF